jgi:putative two-component system response regulator
MDRPEKDAKQTVHSEDEIHELEPVPHSVSPSLSGESDSAEHPLDFLRRTLSASPFPYIIIDSALNILWENEAYRTLFSLEDPREESRLTADFPRSLDNETTAALSEALTDSANGYAYRGRVESFHPLRLSVIANLTLTPLYVEGIEPPDRFLGSFDDVTAEQRSLLQNTFNSLLEASKLKDNDTGKHIQRVGEYSRLIADHLFREQQDPNITREFVDSIAFLAPMHDVGKIGTPDDILNKEGPLDTREWEIMQEHTINGAYILNSYPDSMAKQIALFHHEWWDGSGYPYQMAEDMIPVPARIVAIADVYDALRMSRSYKEAFSHVKALEIMHTKTGTHFDPDLFAIFQKLENTISGIYEQLRDAG